MIRTVLRTEHVTMQFGGVIAVNDLNIVVKEHEIIALIGPNGAGKTTAFNDITGVYTPTKGRVIYTKTNGQEIDIKKAQRDRAAGHCPHLPEHSSLQRPECV